MKKFRLLGMVSVLACVIALVGCTDKKSNTASQKGVTYHYVYATDPNSMDYLLVNKSDTSQVVTNLIDGLLENDRYGNLIPSMAESWTVSPDGLVYTYKLRKNASWFMASGEEYAKVTAHDFVTGLKYAADHKSEALYVVQQSIKGLDDYVNGKTHDFSTVGVKALDDYTVQYTLTQPESYWNSKTTYTILFPVNAEFLRSKGEDFGDVGDPESLLYNGPYLLKSMTIKSQMEFEKNPRYWDAKNVHIDEVKLTYYDGQDQDSLFNNFDQGAYESAALYPNSPSYKTAEKKYADNIIYGPQDSSTFMVFFNMNRSKLDFSKKTKEQQADTTKALRNKDFRQAMTFAFDRASYNAQSAGEQAKNKALRNLLVPPTFVQINGQDFGKVVKDDLNAYGSQWDDVNFTDAQDAFYNPQKARASFEKAKKALLAQGVKFPIQLDYVVDQTATSLVQGANSMKQSIEASLGKENVQINVVQKTTDEWLSATFYAKTPAQNDYDIAISGWSPDYQDPKTFMDTLGLLKDAGLVMRLGVDSHQLDKAFVHEIGLDTYQQLIEKADAIRTDVNARYTAYAKAQAYLTDQAYVIPIVSNGGKPSVTRVLPFTRAFSWVGSKGDGATFKFIQLGKDPIRAKDYAQKREQWEKERQQSNAQAAKDLAKHVQP